MQSLIATIVCGIIYTLLSLPYQNTAGDGGCRILATKDHSMSISKVVG
jgi:hypothetical protein